LKVQRAEKANKLKAKMNELKHKLRRLKTGKNVFPI